MPPLKYGVQKGEIIYVKASAVLHIEIDATYMMLFQ